MIDASINRSQLEQVYANSTIGDVLDQNDQRGAVKVHELKIEGLKGGQEIDEKYNFNPIENQENNKHNRELFASAMK